MSLRLRLVLLIALALSTGVLCTAVGVVADGRSAVRAEVAAATALAAGYVRTAIENEPASNAIIDGVEAILRGASGGRHVGVTFVDEGGAVRAPGTRRIDADPPAPPRWLAGLLQPTPIVLTVPLSATRDAGTFIIRSNPADEVAEIWTYVRGILVTLGISFAGTLALVYLFVTVALRPLRGLSGALRSVEAGRYERCPDATNASEVREVVASYNAMVQRLREATDEKRALARRLVSAQEEERRALANDLHDDLGPSLFALSVDAAAIRHISERGGPGAEIARRADSILDNQRRMQHVVRAILERLRPAHLEHLSLTEALENLVEAAGLRHPAVAWELDLDSAVPALDRGTALAVYRIVQESVSNALRHGRASQIAISLRPAANEPGPPREVRLDVTDNGCGMAAGSALGLGLLSIRERVAALGGRLRLQDSAPHGLTVCAILPCGEAAA